jgi:hypothetical protein
MSTEFNNPENEPTAPTIEIWHCRPAPSQADYIGTPRPESGSDLEIRIRGDWQREKDRSAWLQDMKERQARSAELEAKRRQLNEQASKPIDVVSELDSASKEIRLGSSYAQSLTRDVE